MDNLLKYPCREIAGYLVNIEECLMVTLKAPW